ncbi:glycosyl hydrolase family 3 [Pseudomonas asuensis]|uniref:Glycosyl hydrolase family 3 n=1 Tax=Pseudomonas asuensis TaxID=1825787 RepID=A0ABQ2GYX3_9PSED|nr:glycoside hydrolase family 3 protein [Pseudomonas asuensis]GGM18001.1 glycosyl hydrolase family 3 [Pseudomonas asuensis]
MFKETFKKSLLVCCIAQASYSFATPVVGNKVEAKVEKYLGQMSIKDLINYTRAVDGYMIPPQPKLGLPGSITYDSSMGVHTTDPLPGTQFPSPSALAASWSINRAKEYGLAIGYETRELGGQQLIAPGLNLYRLPYGGRSGEYLSGEDPFIGSVLGAAVSNALQIQGVQAVGKHLVVNDQEANRHYLDVKVDERTLRELYLPGFESAVKNSNVASIMCSFNKINGDYGCENHHLLTGILKKEWLFKGFVMTDYDGMESPIKAALAGTDLEMPNGKFFTQANLLPYLQSGELSRSVMEDKARRNLRAMVSYGFDKGLPDVDGIKDKSHGAAAALNMAREGIVLLKNSRVSQGKPLLPLGRDARIAVVGTMANSVPPSPFGSHYTIPTQYVNELSGLKALAGENAQIDFLDALSLNPETAVWYQPGQKGSQESFGLKAEYFNNADLSGEPVVTRVEPGLNWNWLASMNATAHGKTTTDGFEVPTEEGTGPYRQPDIEPTAGNFSARFTGMIKPTISGDHVFKVQADGPYRLWVNNKLIIDDSGEPVAADLVYTTPNSGKAVNLKAGQEYSVRLEYRRLRTDFVGWNGGFTGVRMSWASLTAPDELKQYDAVVVAAGLNGEYEGEAFDHPFELPEYQSDLIQNLSRANRKTIVVLHGGAGHKMIPWVNTAGAVLEAWYPGQQGGQALAEVMYGDVNPSGKLPISIERNIEDNPAYASYPDIMAFRGDDPATEMTYSEGLYIGYRGYDRNHIRPLYPFGYGLSYTNFRYGNLKLSSSAMTPGQRIQASFTVTNTGKVAGYEVAQLYVKPLNSKVDRPLKELKGFDKVYLEPGQTKVVTIPLDERSLAYFNVKANTWQVDAGRYMVKVGSSSENLPLSRALVTLYDNQLSTTTSNPLPKPLQKAVQISKSHAY